MRFLGREEEFFYRVKIEKEGMPLFESIPPTFRPVDQVASDLNRRGESETDFDSTPRSRDYETFAMSGRHKTPKAAIPGRKRQRMGGGSYKSLRGRQPRGFAVGPLYEPRDKPLVLQHKSASGKKRKMPDEARNLVIWYDRLRLFMAKAKLLERPLYVTRERSHMMSDNRNWPDTKSLLSLGGRVSSCQIASNNIGWAGEVFLGVSPKLAEAIYAQLEECGGAHIWFLAQAAHGIISGEIPSGRQAWRCDASNVFFHAIALALGGVWIGTLPTTGVVDVPTFLGSPDGTERGFMKYEARLYFLHAQQAEVEAERKQKIQKMDDHDLSLGIIAPRKHQRPRTRKSIKGVDRCA